MRTLDQNRKDFVTNLALASDLGLDVSEGISKAKTRTKPDQPYLSTTQCFVFFGLTSIEILSPGEMVSTSVRPDAIRLALLA